MREEEKKNKIKVIYIAGSGHCGSTLLDLLIGSSPEVFSVGELSFFNIYQKRNEYNKKNPNFLCTCKKKFPACPFWERVCSQGRFNIKKYYSWKDNINIFTKILRRRPGGQEQTDDSYAIFSVIKKEAKKEKPKIKYILDSSKDPRRLFYLMNDSRIEVHPILLIKSSRGVAQSYIKTGNRILFALTRKKKFETTSFNEKEYASKYNILYQLKFFSFVCMWWLINFSCEKLIKKNKKAITVKYESFCNNPEHFLDIINKKYGINIPLKNYLQRVNTETFHNIEGNNLRFNKIKKIEAK